MSWTPINKKANILSGTEAGQNAKMPFEINPSACVLLVNAEAGTVKRIYIAKNLKLLLAFEEDLLME